MHGSAQATPPRRAPRRWRWSSGKGLGAGMDGDGRDRHGDCGDLRRAGRRAVGCAMGVQRVGLGCAVGRATAAGAEIGGVAWARGSAVAGKSSGGTGRMCIGAVGCATGRNRRGDDGYLRRRGEGVHWVAQWGARCGGMGCAVRRRGGANASSVGTGLGGGGRDQRGDGGDLRWRGEGVHWGTQWGARRGAIGGAVRRKGARNGSGMGVGIEGDGGYMRQHTGGRTLGCAVGCTRRWNGVGSAAERGREREQRGHGG
ncbi:hypothetical protein C8R44DRAFT_860304 [Mycena epipterygia]|nr:hypothetical protein C8R44DRAFT_860304 [Mycena epipterygia]